MDGERCSVLSMTLLSRFSTAQANSAMSVAPTMRPEPFSVWNARRMPASASVSSGFCSQAGNSLAIRATSSRASSIYRASSSGSMLTVLEPIGGWPDWCSVGRALHARRSHARLQRVRAGGGAGVGEQHGGGIRFRPQRRHGRHHALRHLRQRLQAGLRVVEHVPRIRAAGLQRLHVVLEADHRVREPVEVVRRHSRATRLQQFLEFFAMPSTISTARVLPSMSSPALIPG